MTSLRKLWVLSLLAGFFLAFAVAPTARAEAPGASGAWSGSQSFVSSLLTGVQDAWSTLLAWTGLEAPHGPATTEEANRSAVDHQLADPATPLPLPTDGDAGSDQDPHGIP